MSESYAPAPKPSHRLVPSQFAPIGAFDSVATADDLAAVMELAGWTADPLVSARLARLPPTEWVYGRPNASLVMAAFLHVAPGGMRFNGPDLGAWYAAEDLRTCAAEVGHHLRRETVARAVPTMHRIYRAFSATLVGQHLDLRDQQHRQPEAYDPTITVGPRRWVNRFVRRAALAFSTIVSDGAVAAMWWPSARATLSTLPAATILKSRSRPPREESMSATLGALPDGSFTPRYDRRPIRRRAYGS